MSNNASNKVGLEVNADETKYMLLFHHETVGQNHVIKKGNRLSENVAQFKYLEITDTNQNFI
jgi:hypothetical protein